MSVGLVGRKATHELTALVDINRKLVT